MRNAHSCQLQSNWNNHVHSQYSQRHTLSNPSNIKSHMKCKGNEIVVNARFTRIWNSREIYTNIFFDGVMECECNVNSIEKWIQLNRIDGILISLWIICNVLQCLCVYLCHICHIWNSPQISMWKISSLGFFFILLYFIAHCNMHTNLPDCNEPFRAVNVSMHQFRFLFFLFGVNAKDYGHLTVVHCVFCP